MILFSASFSFTASIIDKFLTTDDERRNLNYSRKGLQDEWLHAVKSFPWSWKSNFSKIHRFWESLNWSTRRGAPAFHRKVCLKCATNIYKNPTKKKGKNKERKVEEQIYWKKRSIKIIHNFSFFFAKKESRVENSYFHFFGGASERRNRSSNCRARQVLLSSSFITLIQQFFENFLICGPLTRE